MYRFAMTIGTHFFFLFILKKVLMGSELYTGKGNIQQHKHHDIEHHKCSMKIRVDEMWQYHCNTYGYE